MNQHPTCMFCASQEMLNLPSAFALSADELRAFPWLTICSDAPMARQELQENPWYQEAWIASSDEVAGINLAAAIKRDTPRLAVYLVQDERPAGLFERVRLAGIDGVLSSQELVWRCETHDAACAPPDESAVEPPSSAVEPSPSPSVPKKSDGEAVSATACSEALLSDTASAVGGGPVAQDYPALSLSGEARRGYLLSVFSGSGGVGKSTVAALIGHLAQRRGLRTVLVDGDLQFGDLAELCGTAVRLPIDELPDPLELPGPLPEADPVLVAAPRHLEAAEAVAPRFASLVQQLLGQFDLVVVNTGGAWGDHHAFLLETSATALFLIDQRASSVRACRHGLDLCLRCGIATGSFLLALNRCGKQAPFTAADVSAALQGARVIELREGGREVEELMGAGLADALVCAGNPLCQSIERLLDELVPGCRRPAACQRSMALEQRPRQASPGQRGGRRRERASRSRRRKGRPADELSLVASR